MRPSSTDHLSDEEFERRFFPKFGSLQAPEPEPAPRPDLKPVVSEPEPPRALIGLSEAARLSGRGRTTIHCALVAGRLGCVTRHGKRRIDPDELVRVFPPNVPSDVPQNTKRNIRNTKRNTSDVPCSAQRIAELEAVLSLVRKELHDLGAAIEGLRRQLDWFQAQCDAVPPNTEPNTAPNTRNTERNTERNTSPSGDDPSPSPRGPGRSAAGPDSCGIGDSDLKSLVFGNALAWLAHASNRKLENLRPLLGRWCRDFGNAFALDAIAAAQTEKPVDPIGWIEQRLKTDPRRNQRKSGIIPMHPGAGG
jgi:hypothetical protein